MARLGGRGRHNGANAIVHLAREVVGRRRTLQNATQEVRNAVILDSLADEDFRALDTTIAERTTSDREFAQTLARLTYTASRAKGFDRCVVDAALRLDSLIPVDDPAHERDKLLRDAYASAQKASYIRGGRLALGRLGRRAVEAGDLERARVLLHQQLDLGPEKDDTPAEVDSALVLGDILRREGDHDQAQIYYRRAGNAAERLEYRQGVAEALVRQIDSTPSSNLETVAALQHQALDAARRTGDQTLEARILVGLADTMLDSSRTQDATTYFRDALVIAEQTGDLALEARCVTALATAYRQLGQTLDAVAAKRSALRIEERLGNRPAAATWALSLGMSELELRDPEAAAEAFDRARILGGQIGDLDVQQRAEGGLGVANTLLRRGPETIDHLSRAIELARQARDTAHEAKWISSLGQAYWMFGQIEDATRTTNEAISLAEAAGNTALQAELFTLLGQIHASQRETIRARDCYTRALQLNRDLHQTAEQVSTLTALAALAAETGQFTQAAQLFDQSLGLAMSIDDRRMAAVIHGRIGSLARRRNDTRAALEHFARAVEMADALDDAQLLNRALQHYATAQDIAGDPDAMLTYERAVNAADAAADVRGGISMRLNMGVLLSRLDEPGAAEDAIGWLSDAANYAMEAGPEYGELRTQAEQALQSLGGSGRSAAFALSDRPDHDDLAYPDDRYAVDDAPYAAGRDYVDAGRREDDRYLDATDPGYEDGEAWDDAEDPYVAASPDRSRQRDAWDEPDERSTRRESRYDDAPRSVRTRQDEYGFDDRAPATDHYRERDDRYAEDDRYADPNGYAADPYGAATGQSGARTARRSMPERYTDDEGPDEWEPRPGSDRLNGAGRDRGYEQDPYTAGSGDWYEDGRPEDRSAPARGYDDYDESDLTYQDSPVSADRYTGARYDSGPGYGYEATEDDHARRSEGRSSDRTTRRAGGRRAASSRGLDDDPSEPDGDDIRSARRDEPQGARWSLRDRLAWQRRGPASGMTRYEDTGTDPGTYSDY